MYLEKRINTQRLQPFYKQNGNRYVTLKPIHITNINPEYNNYGHYILNICPFN